jgi:hypothetical protein
MLKKLIGPVLVGVLIASAVFNLWASVRYYFAVKDAYKFQAWGQHINNTLGAAQLLANDANKYSERNPAIDPILIELHLKAKPGSAPASSPPSVRLPDRP